MNELALITDVINETFPSLVLERSNTVSVDEASTLLAVLLRDVRDEKDATRLLAQLEFANVASEAAALGELEKTVSEKPDDLDARYQLGAQYVMNNQLEAALETYLQLLMRDSSYREGAARNSLLAIFELLGNQGELVSNYRRKLFTLMH